VNRRPFKSTDYECITEALIDVEAILDLTGIELTPMPSGYTGGRLAEAAFVAADKLLQLGCHIEVEWADDWEDNNVYAVRGTACGVSIWRFASKGTPLMEGGMHPDGPMAILIAAGRAVRAMRRDALLAKEGE
jgi:hypothetical protein